MLDLLRLELVRNCLLQELLKENLQAHNAKTVDLLMPSGGSKNAVSTGGSWGLLGGCLLWFLLLLPEMLKNKLRHMKNFKSLNKNLFRPDVIWSMPILIISVKQRYMVTLIGISSMKRGRANSIFASPFIAYCSVTSFPIFP